MAQRDTRRSQRTGRQRATAAGWRAQAQALPLSFPVAQISTHLHGIHMTSSTALLDCLETQTGPDPQRSVIWLHGLGADANDFLPIVPELDLRGLPAVRFVFP